MIFRPTDPAKIIKDDLYEAKRLLLEHQKAAEYHAAMAGMLKLRIGRLQSPQPEIAPTFNQAPAA